MDTGGKDHCPIAVVGIGCRMPGGVSNPQEFWDVLVNGQDMITEIPPDRWSIESFHDPDQSNHSKMVTKKCGFIHDIDKFDNTFFKISPREAASMDPQQRHILEVTYEAFQDAGIIPESLGEQCGVYMGVGMMDYPIMLMDTSLTNPYTHTGIGHSAVANRISYAFNLRGPSTVVDTACASSVTALHMACCAIWNGECSTAVAGGCNSLLLPEVTVGFSALGVLSPEGKCCPFSDTAKGYVRSEGWGTFILKPLTDALENNDHVYAVIRGSAIAANGYSKSLTMPSAEAQEMVMRNTYNRFNIPMSSVQYVEAHGTGTPVGDPIEATAIGAAFGTERQSPLKIGSVKSNFGHNECAAGITAAIKVALMLNKKKLIPTINFHEINPAIDLHALNIRVQTECEEIEDQENPYTIGLNSFGFAGAVAHMVFQAAPPPTPTEDTNPMCGWSFGKGKQSEGSPIIIPLSAKTPEALKELAKNWGSFSFDEDALSVSSWQATRQEHHQCRMTVIANSAESFCDTINTYTQDLGSESLIVGKAIQHKPKICFIFPGQGQQWIDMGRQLFQEETIFRESIEECDRMFHDLSGWSVLTSCGMFNSGGIEDTSLFGSTEEALENVEVIQPAIIFIQIGMYNLWRHWGVEPHVVVGHSLGEVAAAYASGGLSLQEAIAVIYHRSNQQAKLTGTGRMVAMRANVDQTKSICQEYNNVHIAAINGPGAITLAGDGDEIAAIVADNPGKAKQLRVTCAFHTSEMDPMKTPFLHALDGILTCGSDRTVPFYSSVTGHYYQEAFDAQYWWNNVRNPVLFQPAIEDILQDTDIDIFLEVSSAATLLSCVKQIVRAKDPQGSVTTVNSSLRGKDDLHSMQRAVSSLYVAGLDINWKNVTKSSAQWAPVPTYPWQHQSFWLETEDRQKLRLGLDDRSFKGQKGKTTLSNFPFLADHVVDGRILFPGAGYVEYIVQMSFEDTACPELRDVNFLRVLPWPEESDSKRGILNLEYIKEGQNVQVKCDQNLHCNASTDTIVEREHTESSLPVTEIFKRCNSEVSKEDLYRRMQRVGLNYGPTFQTIDRCYMGDGESLAYLSAITDSSQRVSIAHLDATFQLALSSIGPCTSMYLPVHIDSIRMTRPSLPIGQTLLVYTSIVDCDSNTLTADITLATESGVILLTVKGFQAQNFHGNKSNVDIENCIYTTHWQPLSACTLPPAMIKEVYDESHLRRTYGKEMDAIDRAEDVLGDIEGVCASYIRNALSTVPEEQRCKGQSYEKYISRFKAIASTSSVKDIPHHKIPETIQAIQNHCPDLDAELSLMKSLGDALPDTFRDPQVAVPIMFSPEGLDRYFYDSLSTRVHYKSVADAVYKLVSTSLTKKRVVRVLELGARIGGLTRFVMELLKEYGLANQIEYVFTDVSATFFKQAQENLSMYPFIQYKQLDIENDISEQGFVPGSFDVVICLDTLHAAVDVQRSTSFMTNLLSPDGLMFIIEGTNTHFMTELWFGAMDVCWVFDDFRKDRCWMDRQSWTDVMRRSGLQDVTSASTPKEFFHSVIVGRKDHDSSRQMNNKLNITNNNEVIMKADHIKLMIVREISNRFEDEIKTAYKGSVDIRSFSDAKSFEQDISDNKSSQMEVMYIYSNADVKLHALLKLLQAVEQNPEGVRRVWVLTKSATENLTEGTTSLPIGLARAVANHIPNVPIRCVDFDPGYSLKDNVGEMMRLLEEPDVAEGELMIRKGIRFAPRIMHQELKTSSMVSENWRVEQPASASNGISNSIDNLEFHDINTFDLPPGSVNIRVRATPLNFKDIMMAMGLLEGLESDVNPSFGIECAGVVESIGAGVHNVRVGDEVIAFGKKCFASHVVCDARLTTLKPQRLGWTESATVGVVFVTAYLALVERANLQPSETVLIHSACGGVGLAAVQIARMIGANVICTAGTEEKRKYLRDVLGVELVSDSRSTLFYDDIMSYTDGKGVDVVLNSLSGNLLATSMLVLAPGGRFCEIGKRDILQNSSLSMNALLENKTFISCQVDILMKQRPELVQRLMKRVVHLIETSILHPVPTEVYPMHQVKEAFRFMSKGSHIGKIVFDIGEGYTPAEVKPALQQFSSRGTYIITGGYGGIGQALARWLCDNGAKYIVLVSRNGAKSAASQRMVKYLRKKQVTVHQFQVDIAEHRCVKSMLEDLRDSKDAPPIKGIFHLAGVIEEENLSEITHEQVNRILGAKAVGAYNLHTLTKDEDLDVFFLLSSISAVWGHPAQPIYCAANNYLDTLAEQRHSEGLPALSVQLAPVRGAGYLEDKEDTVKVLAMKGNLQVHVDEFLHILGRLLHQRDLPVVCLANQDWASTQQFCHESMLKFHHLAAAKGQATDTADKTIGKDDVEQGIKSKMADLLCMATETIDINQPMINYGVDSLVALEMVNWATNKLGVTISQLDILGGITTAGLLQKALGE